MKRLLIVAIGFYSLLLLTGCGVFSRAPYEAVEIVDLRAPAPETIMKPFRFGVFRNISGADRRFMRFEGKNRVAFSETQKFLQSPEVMLERFLRESLIPNLDNQNPAIVIDAVISRIGFDVIEKRAILNVEFVLYSKGREQRCGTTFEGRFGDNITPGEAMNHCFTEALSHLRRYLVEHIK